MIKTILAWTVLGFLLFTGLWYFYLKDSDYSISFKSSQSPGEAYQSLLYYPFDEEFGNSQIIQKVPFDKLVQEVEIDGEKHELTWNFSEESDFGSLVKIGINSTNSFRNRLKLLFKSSKPQSTITEEIKEVKRNLEENSDLYSVKIIGKAISPATTCACISLKNGLDQKAFDMIKNISRLSDYIMESKAEMTAKPRIIVNSWDRESNIITYDFCFPIADGSTAPPSGISIKEIPSANSLKAIYNGNYMYSHLAWMQLIKYAEDNNMEVQNTPQEIFNDNPEMGGDARAWEAEIFMPLK